MAQKIIKIGSSLGVTLSGAVLKLAGLRVGDTVSVSFDEAQQVIKVESSRQDELTQDLAFARSLVRKHSAELAKLGDE